MKEAMKAVALGIIVLGLSACAANPPTTPERMQPEASQQETPQAEAAPENAEPSLEEKRAAFQAYCDSAVQPPCRRDVAFDLVLDEQGNTKSFAFDLLPPAFQQNGTLSILPGETLYLTGDFIGGKLILPQVSYERPEKGAYLQFSFEQDEGTSDMLLGVANTYDQPVKYRLVFMSPEDDQLYKTSSCPVIANGRALEHWSHAIFQLIVIEVHVLEASDEMVCEW